MFIKNIFEFSFLNNTELFLFLIEWFFIVITYMYLWQIMYMYLFVSGF